VYALGTQIVSGTMEVSESAVCYCIDMEIVRYYFTIIGYTQLATANDESMASQMYGSEVLMSMMCFWCGMENCRSLFCNARNVLYVS
jgi:hypothetical protein